MVSEQAPTGARGEVLLAVDAASLDCTRDDRYLLRALAGAGFAPRPLRWGGEVPQGSTVIVRSTWDYIERPAAFAEWLDLLDARRAVVHNPTDLMRWNMHKRYLLDLAAAGVPTVPTELVPAGGSCSIADLMQQRGWQAAVVKPAIGGTARLAATSARVGVAELQRHLDQLVTREDALVQPYVSSIEHTGEFSIIAIGGAVLLAVRKAPSRGEWRVQSDFGGTATAVPLPDDVAAIAGDVLAWLPTTPTYARLDVVRDDGGSPQVMECELVEPELFFRLDPAVAEAFVDVLVSGSG